MLLGAGQCTRSRGSPAVLLYRHHLLGCCVGAGKDAGRLAAAWALYKAQEELVAVSWCHLAPGAGLAVVAATAAAMMHIWKE